MQSIQGFLLINIYAFIIILSTGIVFIRKQRLKQMEDETYKKFLLANILMSASGMFLGLLVNPEFYVNNDIIVIFNKIYLICLYFWIYILTFYIFYISLKDKSNIKKHQKIFNVITIISIIMIVFLPIKVTITETGAAVAEGLSVLYTYIMFAIGFITEIVCVLKNYKELKNKKYIPLYLLILMGTLVLVINMINPSLNYIINPALIFIAVIMYHTIENPDAKIIAEAHHAKEISDNANEEKTLFLFNMTQEIRQVTNKINEDTDIILNSKDYEEIYDTARDIKARSNVFSSATNEILDMSSVDATTIKIYENKYNVKNIIKQLVNVYGDICKNKDLIFRTNIDHDIPDSLYGDGINLKEVLTTILNNSTKYTDKGYVEFNVNTIIKNDICRLIFTIEDSGTGIKSQDINKIKVDNKSLAKANKMITLMNGTMLISSDYGIGTKVKVIIDQKIGETEETEVSKYESTFDNIEILSVDDSESGLKIIEKLLKGTNIKLDLASTGKECIDKIKIGKYDLILLDEELSQISGIELMQKIQEIRNFNTPVILLTKDNSYEYNEEYTKVGFVDYILKPLKKEDLLTKINKYTKKDKK